MDKSPIILTYEKAKKAFSYDPESGVITRIGFIREDCANDLSHAKLTKIWCGKPTGYNKAFPHNMRYQIITYCSRHYRAHHLAVLLMTGSWPENIVDHIDGDGLNNRWMNLRKATQADNTRNRRKTIPTKSGIMGVYWSKKNSKWYVKMTVNGVQSQLYYGDSLDEAVRIRNETAKRLGYHENHGRS